MKHRKDHNDNNENLYDKHGDRIEETAPSISYFTLYRFASRWDKFMIATALIASFISGATMPYSITLVADLFQNMINYDKAVQNGTENVERFLQSVHMFGINYSCVGALLFVGGYLGSTFMNLTAIKQVFKIREEYLRAVLNQDFAYFDLHQTGDFASKMADDVIKLEEGIGDKVSAILYSATTGVGCIIMALMKGWKLALLCLATTPITFLLVGLTGRIADRLYKKEAVQKGIASAVAQEVLSSIRTVFAFNGQKKELERYQKPLAEAKRIYIKKEFFTGLSMGFLFFCVFSSYALSFYLGIYLVINDPESYNADVMFSVFFGVMTALGNLGMVGSLVRSFGVARGAGAQIFRLLDNVPTINTLLNSGSEPYTAEGNIQLKNVGFCYPSRPEVPVLKGVSLTVQRGQSVAIVGHSGSGKSTVIQLISRFYDVTSGSVCVDGVDIRDLQVNWLRSQIGQVRQEPVLFNTTIRENIRYGRQSATDDEIEAVAKQANAHHFIIKLPKSYDTLVGERGASLSGGQKQRIAIARALIRNPRLLLLDEATSALDAASEGKVQFALDKAAVGRSTIVVAHRLSTIRHVDIIYVMKGGEVVESGSHDELMVNKGHYYDMVLLQEPTILTSKVHSMVTKEESRTSDYEEDEPVEPLENDKRSEAPRVTFWRVMSLNAKEWKWLVAGSICSVIIGFSMPLFILIFGDLFGTMSDPDPRNLMNKVEKVSVVCIFIGIVMGTSTLIETLSFGVAGAHLLERLRTRMFAHLLKQHVGYFDEHANSTGALCAKIASEASYVQGGTGQRIGLCLQGFGSIGLAFILAMVFEWRVGVVALAFLPLIVFVVYQQVKATRQESYGNAKSLENSTKIAVEAISNVRTVVSLGREKIFLQEYLSQLIPALATARRAAHCKGLVAGLSRSMFNFINAAALTYGGHLIVAEGVPYHNILVTTQSLQMASGQAQNAFTYAPQFQKSIDAASRIIVMLNAKPKIGDPVKPVVSPFKSKGEASLKDVVFKYPSRPGAQVLRGLNLQVDTGKTIALVGSSGCGKSTVIQLLQRFYDPDKGLACLDSIPLQDLIMSEARSAFGLVSQEPVLFDYSIAENIAYGDLQRSVTQADVKAAALQANIHHFIVSLPRGYETRIGQKGMQLSGGQKQRMAIARALIRHPKILLLDEATSALDTENEKVVQEALDAAKSGRTCVMIAHRLSTVRDADLICVISGGLIVEMGSQRQLLDAKGYYNLHSGL